MTAKNPTPAVKPNVSQAKVKKYSPPPPNPTRPAAGANVPLKPDCHGYHGDPPGEKKVPLHPPIGSQQPITGDQKQQQE